MLLPVTVLLPVLPMFIGILLCIPLSMLLNRLKNHNVLRLVFQVLFFLAAMALYMVFLNSMYKFDGSGNGDVNALVVLLRSLLENHFGRGKVRLPRLLDGCYDDVCRMVRRIAWFPRRTRVCGSYVFTGSAVRFAHVQT